MKTKLMLSLLLVSAAFVMPASANWFHNPYENINRNVGSAPNPTPADLREDRLPIVTKDEDKTDTAAAEKPRAPTTRAARRRRAAARQALPAAAPAR